MHCDDLHDQDEADGSRLGSVRTRLSTLVLAPVLVVLSLSPLSPPVASAATSTEQQVTDLNAEVQRVAERLSAGTAALEEGQAELREVEERAQDVRRDADEARDVAEASQTRLEDLVGASYRTPRPGAFTVALGDLPGMTERLHVTASLEQVQGRQQDLVSEANADRLRAQVLLREAEALEAEAAAQAQALAEKVEGLKQEAQQAQARLEEARQRLEAERAAAAKKAAEERAAAAARASRARAAEAARTPAAAPAPAPAGKVSGGGGSCGGGSLSGYANGMLPASALCPLRGTSGLLLRADAAAAFNRMAAAGGMPCAGNSYRSYSQQVALYAQKPSLAAVPGTSNHGWGVAIDFACGAERFGSPGYQWLKANGPKYGWTHPSWAEPGGSRPEPWHWEYTG